MELLAHRAPIAALAVALALASSTACATSQRTFVGSSGSDSNPCSIVLPCRSFAAAAAQTSPFGEIVILDSAGYGIVTLTQSISIIAPSGVYGGISVPSGQSGITINNASAYVVLRGLSINGQGGSNGILVQAATRVRIESCIVSRMFADGIAISASVPTPDVHVSDSVISENAVIGIHVLSGAMLAVDRTRVEANNSNGIANEPGASFTLSVTNSVVAANGGHGIELRALGTTTVNASVSDSEVSGNGFNAIDIESGGPAGVIWAGVARNTMRGNYRGVYLLAASPGATYADVHGNTIVGNNASGVYATGSKVTLSGNSITNNNYGIYDDGSNTIETIGNNLVRNNPSGDVTGIVTVLPGV